MPETVRLTPAEMMQAALVGIMRQVQNIGRGRRDAHGFDGPAWQVHIEGACGEMAAAKALGQFWSGNLGHLRADDVGSVQVRTRSRPDYDLIVHPSDPDDRPFVLVRGTAPDYEVAGWIMGRDAKRDEWWREPVKGRPAYFVPAGRLRDIADLRAAPELRQAA